MMKNYYIILLYLLLNVIRMNSESSVFEFNCPFYKVTGDYQALSDNVVKCPIWICPGQSVEASLCGNSYGDNFIRLFENNTQRAANDDYW